MHCICEYLVSLVLINDLFCVVFVEMMDNDVNQRRVAVFSIIYIYSLNIYSLWVPRPLRITCEALILLAVSGCGLSCPTASL